MAAIQSLHALLQQSSIDDHDEIIKACNAALKVSKTNLEAQHVKTVAFLKQDRFEDALRVIEEGGDGLKERATFEWAYALYKTGELERAIEVAASSGSGRGAKHLEAQAAYRAEDFQRAKAIYDGLYKDRNASDQEYTDMRINMTATEAQRLWAGFAGPAVRSSPNASDLEVFETTYNIACEYIARGDLKHAGQLIKRAKELCKSSQDLSQEDKDAELLPIMVQELYIALRQGKSDHAENLIEKLNISGISELSTKKIAQNNLIIAQKEPNPYVQYKLFHGIPNPSESDKLFSYQSGTLHTNSTTAELLVHKYDGVIRSTSKILSKQKSATLSTEINSASILNVAAHNQKLPERASVKHTRSYLAQRPHDTALTILAVQQDVQAGNLSSAVSTLETFLQRLDKSKSQSDQELRYTPGLVSILVALYKHQGRKKQIHLELSKAAAFWSKMPEEKKPLSLLRAAASSLLHSPESSDLRSASELFNTLHAADPTDTIATAGYVASFNALSPEAPKEISNLSPINNLIFDIDLTALENAGVPSSSTAIPAPSSSRKRKAEVDDAEQTPKKKRIRISRFPKDYDPNKQPDPERWLPLRDRSSYRPKGKKKQKAADRTQGGIVNEKTESSPAPTTNVVQKSQGGGGKKKKGKGKR